jgi:muramidase (phage lysozyme)
MAEQLTPEEIKAAFDAYNRELLLTGQVTKDTANAFADAKAGIRNYTFQLNQCLKQLGQASLNFVGALHKGEQGASVYNESIKSGADAVESFTAKFGILGKILGAFITAGAKYVIAVNEQSDKLFASYQQLSRVGAAGASGMSGVFKSMQDFGYNVEQLGDFGNLIKANSESLALMGGTVNQGTQVFAGMAKGIQRSGLQTEFLRMGMTVDQINSGLGGYLRIQTLTGTAQRKTQSELTQGAAEYIKNLDILTKLTGKNAETLQQEREARMNEQRFIAVQMELEDKAAQARLAGDETQARAFEKQMDQNQKLLDLAPKEMQAGLIGAMTGFAGSSKEAEQLFRVMPELFQKVASQSFEAAETLDSGVQRAGSAMRGFGGLAKVGGFDEVFGSMAGINKLRVKGLEKSYAEQDRIASAELKDQVENTEAGVKAQVGMRQEHMEATRALQTFTNQGVNRTTAAMSKLSGAIETVVSKIPGTGPDTGTTGTGRGNVSSLLDIIGRGESGGNYNALVGGGSANLTGMTIAEVQQLQSTMIKGGRPSTAVGKYQMIAETLAAQAKKAGLDPNTTKFDQQTQDLLASQLVGQAGYGSKDPATVMKNLAGTWASLPQDMSGRGRYDGYNTNKANINPNDLMAAIQSGPRDSYSSALQGVNPGTVRANTAGTETASAVANARTSNDLIVIQISKMDELIGLMKANNTINSKILQRSRN